jgi:ketosteroid isomerase-like protein
MSAQANKTLVQRLFEEVWNQNNLTVANEIIHKEYSSIENQVFASTPGPEIVAAEIKLYHSLYDGLHFQVEQMFAEGDTIVTVWKADGVSKTETFVARDGQSVPKTLRAEGASLSEIKDGRIAAHRFFWQRDPLFP